MKEVIVYSSSTCNYCGVVKEFLTEKGIEFTEKNISTDKEARKELIAMGHMSVPVTLIDGEEVIGLDKEKLNELLG